MLAMLLSLALQHPAAPVPPQRLHLDVTTYNELDQTPIGKPKMSGGLATSAFVTVSMADTIGGQIATIRVDSLTLKPTGELVAEVQRRPNSEQDARGATARVLVVRGRIAGILRMSDSTNPALTAIAQVAGVLFPPIRRDAKVGQSWADTNHVNNGAGSRKQTGDIIVTWTVTGIQPGGALIVDGISTTRTRTDDTASSQSMTLTGRSKEHMVLPLTGPVRQASVETSSEMSVTAPQLPGPIPGKNNGTMTITPIP